MSAKAPLARTAVSCAMLLAATPVSAGGAAGSASPDTHRKELARVLSIVARKDGCRDLTRKEVKAILGTRTPKSFEGAAACVRAAGRAVSVAVQTSCGGDSCVVEGWLFTDVRAPMKVPHENELDVSLDVRFLYYTRLTPTKKLGEYDVDVARRDLDSGAETSLAKCASPRLSPAGKWVLCRTRTDDVLAVPAAGGATTMVAKGAGTVTSWTPYANEFPSAVEFVGTNAFEVWIGGVKKRVAWKE